MADIKRMNYFDQQFLVVGDFIAEQAYHREMRLLHNRSLHTYGVARGLDVTLSGAREVMISAGVAIDNQGREITLSNNTPYTLTNDPAGGPLLITISYDDEETDPYGSLPGKNTRIRETFSITDIPEGSADPDTQAVTLARVKLDAQGNIEIDATARRWAGPLSDETSEVAITLGRLRLGGRSIPNSQWPSLTASGPNQLTVGGGLFAQSLEVAGDITLNGSLRAGGDLSGRNLSITGALSAPNATINGALSVGGSLVIGTGNPQANLQVASGAIVPSVGNSPQAGIQFPPNPGGGSGDEAFIRYFATDGETTKLQIGIGNDADDSIGLVQAGAERLTVVNGNVGIGSTNPENSEGWNRVLDLLGGTATKLSVRTNAIDARVMAHERGWWGAPAGMVVGTKGNHSLSLATNAAARLSILANGDVGIGTTDPKQKLHVKGNFIRVDGAGNEQCYIGGDGSANDVQLGSFNSSVTRVALYNPTTSTGMDLAARNIVFSGNLTGAGKGGYVMDQFINKLGESLEEGDVVVVGLDQSPLVYGLRGNIPIPEVDLAQNAYDARVCGVVCELSGALKSESDVAQGTGAKDDKKSKKTVQAFTPEEVEKLGHARVQPGHLGWMVTLGAFAHCKVDADIAPINAGDLLTTSPTKGHAQKALDPAKAVGAIIGKALGSLKKGKGKIPVLVMLQ